MTEYVKKNVKNWIKLCLYMNGQLNVLSPLLEMPLCGAGYVTHHTLRSWTLCARGTVRFGLASAASSHQKSLIYAIPIVLYILTCHCRKSKAQKMSCIKKTCPINWSSKELPINLIITNYLIYHLITAALHIAHLYNNPLYLHTRVIFVAAGRTAYTKSTGPFH